MKNKVINLFGEKIIPNTEVKYSKLLEKFMTPFAKEFENMEYVEDIFEFAISAWNTANMNTIIPSEEVEKAMNSIDESTENIALLKKMIAYKEANFKTFTNFVIDFELKEANDGGNSILSVVTQEEEPYLASMLNDMEENIMHNQEDYEENYINRNAIILKPQEPFVDWLISLSQTNELDYEEISKESNIYLIDEANEDVEKWLKKKFDKFFMMELNDWNTNKKEWPQKRNYKMFRLWFQVQTSEMIYDLERKPVLKSE